MTLGGCYVFLSFLIKRRPCPRLGAFADPVFGPLHVQRAIVTSFFRIVRADDFDKFAVAWAVAVGHDHLVVRAVFAPSLRNLIETDILTFHSRQLRHHFLHFACAFHHLSHLIKAPQQIVHLSDSAAAAARDALPTPRIQNVRARPLFVRHRKHDGFRALKLLLVNREPCTLLMPGNMPRIFSTGPIFRIILNCARKSLKSNEAVRNLRSSRAASSASTASAAFSTSPTTSPIPESGWRAAPEKKTRTDPAFRPCDEFDRPARYFAHRQSRAASRISIELS